MENTVIYVSPPTTAATTTVYYNSTTDGYSNTTGANIPLPLDTSLIICTVVGSTLSIIGAVVIFLSYCVVYKAKNQTRRLLLYLTIADLLNATGNLLGAIHYSLRRGDFLSQPCATPDEICVIQSFITTSASLASFAWTCVIGFHLLLTLVYQSEWCFKLKAKVLSHVVSWGLPIAITTTAAFYNVLGENLSVSSGPWCWIRGCIGTSKEIMWMTISGKGWEILTYFITMATYLVIKIYMCRRRWHEQRHIRFEEASASRLRDEDEQYLMLWLFMYLLRIWGTVRYGIAVARALKQETIDSLNTTDNVLLYMQSFGDSGMAFVNCILFCVFDGTVRNELLRPCRRLRNLRNQRECTRLINNDPM